MSTTKGFPEDVPPPGSASPCVWRGHTPRWYFGDAMALNIGILPHLLGAAANNLNNNNNFNNNNGLSRNAGGGSSNNSGGGGNPMNSVRDRLFHALFVRVALAYASAVPPSVRTLFEYITLLKVSRRCASRSARVCFWFVCLMCSYIWPALKPVRLCLCVL